MQFLYHIKEINEFISSKEFSDHELQNVKTILAIMNQNKHFIKVSDLYSPERLPKIRAMDNDVGLVLEYILNHYFQFMWII